MSDCIFCKIVAGEIPSPRVYENDGVIVIDDINPFANVHSLIITKKHIPDILALDANDANLTRDILDAIQKTAQIKGIADNGFRLISNCREDGCQTIPHLHIHLLGGQKLGVKIV